MFRDIELFLVVFPSDPNVYDAGTELVVSALRAVEKLIGFYLKCKGRRSSLSTLRAHTSLTISRKESTVSHV